MKTQKQTFLGICACVCVNLCLHALHYECMFVDECACTLVCVCVCVLMSHVCVCVCDLQINVPINGTFRNVLLP